MVCGDICIRYGGIILWPPRNKKEHKKTAMIMLGNGSLPAAAKFMGVNHLFARMNRPCFIYNTNNIEDVLPLSMYCKPKKKKSYLV
jgi:hypothetical protein